HTRITVTGHPDNIITELTRVRLGHSNILPARHQGKPSQMSPIGAADPNPYLGSLAAELADQLPRRALTLDVNGHRLQLRSQSVAIDDLVVPVQAGPMTVLRTLARSPGRLVSSAEIRSASATWSRVDDHAVEMAVSRLRRAFKSTPLDGIDLVQTVMRRGYRLGA
ncbi:winged helix-turn-helix domain-containing protein, partial [Micromonospora sp. NPDC050795]|uniref:winged helix-turn-helix domain-containing protein n=1 Tax=Micromonospora sp. NPDC050795 TaxID=3364282 RepID=UPI0037A826F7